VGVETLSRYLVVGGAGFIGSHFADRLLADPAVDGVTLYDNLSSGREWHYAHHLQEPRFQLVVADVKDSGALTAAMDGHDVVIHLASNPDIARAATEPAIDFDEGTYLTHCVVEAMRLTSASEILYASGSGVYGDLGETEADEDWGPLIPISTYGASKLAGEALIASYCYMFDLRGTAFRLGNVVGARQTHGVGFDFLRRLAEEPTRLEILGDGRQSKSYIHVRDVLNAVLVAADLREQAFEVYNVATGDYVTVAEIARLAAECADLDPDSVRYDYAGGDRGWRGDIPVVRLNIDRITSRGWRPELSSPEALREAMRAMIDDARRGLL
jgi:UDP-glucose 4-epimerase